MTDNIEQHITQEVQRRVGSQMSSVNTEMSNLRELVQGQNIKLVQQQSLLNKLLSEPLTFGTLLKVQNNVDPRAFRTNDVVIVCDRNSQYYRQGGTIISGLNGTPVINSDGFCNVKLYNEIQVQFAVGLEGKDPAQIRLTEKDDGTFSVVSIDGKPWEVKGVVDSNISVGDSVKVKPDTKAIVSKGYNLNSGPVCEVVSVTSKGIEVNNKGNTVLVFNPQKFSLTEGDRVVCDHGMFCVIEKLERHSIDRYKLKTELNVSWEDVGGLENAKQQLRDALELPFSQPELFKFYGVQPLRGILLYGGPGCGKTLLVRAAATAMAKIHGREAVDSGCIFVKSPEILNKWVGNSESEIRELFEAGRRHYREYGYKAILAFDEADAIMSQRGTRRSSDITDTIVPMFLGEMDGIDSKQTEENPLVILLTNRADILDPAIIRAGRINKHIKIDRPTDITAIDILDIHTKNMPFQDIDNRMLTLTLTVSDLFSKSRILYRINNEYDMTMGDIVNGAMLAEIAECAKMTAMHRDILADTKSGVFIDDLRGAVEKLFKDQRGLNHSFDVSEFCEKHGLQPSNIQVERCFGSN